MHGHSLTCEFAMSYFHGMGTIAKITNIAMSRALRGSRYPVKGGGLV